MTMRDESLEDRVALARRGTAVSLADPQLQRIVVQIVERTLGGKVKDYPLLKEKLEVLNGERGKREKAAVRRADLARLQQIPALQSEKVTASPTAEDFNALRADVEAIHQQLAAIAGLLRKAVR